MSVTFQTEGNRLTCYFSKRLDTEVCRNLTPLIDARLAEWTGDVCFDLDQVEYVSSGYLRLCMDTYKKVGSDHFSVIHVSPMIKKVYKVAGFDRYMTIS